MVWVTPSTRHVPVAPASPGGPIGFGAPAELPTLPVFPEPAAGVGAPALPGAPPSAPGAAPALPPGSTRTVPPHATTPDNPSSATASLIRFETFSRGTLIRRPEFVAQLGHERRQLPVKAGSLSIDRQG